MSLTKQSANKQVLLTQGSVGSILISQTLTVMVGMFSLIAFNLVDTFFVGRLGVEPLAAMSFTLPVVVFYGSIAMGLGVGASALISRAFGRGAQSEVQRLTTDSLLLAFMIVCVLMVVGIITMRPLFYFLGARDLVLDQVCAYMQVWYLGVPFVVMPMVGSNAIRAVGNVTVPTTVMFIAFLINTILDPLFIYGMGPFPRLELRGAALATVIGRGFSFFAYLYFLAVRFKMLTFARVAWEKVFSSWREVLYIGMPAAVSNLQMPICMVVITRLIADYGDNAVAAFGVGHRLETVAFMPLMSLGAVLTPFVGQNAGANLYQRVRRSISLSYRFSLSLGAFSFFIFWFWGDRLAAIFNTSPDVYSVAALYLSIISVGFGLLGCTSIASGVCSALKRPLSSLLIISLRWVFLYVPFAWFGSHYFGLKGIFFAGLVSSLLSGLFAIGLVRKVLAQEHC